MKITDMPLEDILKLAEESGYKPNRFGSEVLSQLDKQRLEMMLVRFAHRVEAEMLKSVSDTFKKIYDPAPTPNLHTLYPEFSAILGEGLKAPK